MTTPTTWKGEPIDGERELIGRHVRLQPIAQSHGADLAVAGAASEIWPYLSEPRGPFGSTSDAMAWIDHVLGDRAAGVRVPYAIISIASGRAVGSTSYFLETRWANRTLEVGGTWLTPSVWRTAVNTECKYLLLSHAFEILGADRVEFMTDARNTRSQRAIERLGGRREGTLRAHMLCPDGHRRDSIYYSILEAEWPPLEHRLRELIGGYPSAVDPSRAAQ